jgi:hypothetical protein
MKINMPTPNFNLDKIKFATDPPTFERAVALYEKGKVKHFEAGIGAYSAIVEGSQNYHVSIEARSYGHGFCDCYMGKNAYLCKHMVAVSIYAVLGGKPIPEDEKNIRTIPECSNSLKETSKTELTEIKKSVSAALKYIKAYGGPSRTWFRYQDSLSEGCSRLSSIVSNLPVNAETADVLVNLLLRLDKKLCEGGVDDSDGTVGGFMEEVVEVVKKFVEIDPTCAQAIEILKNRGTCFGWEEPLLKFIGK